jgi:hypothetical protein
LLPWTDMYVRDHRFDQDAMLASVEKLIQWGAAAGYTRTKLVGHHMDWLFWGPHQYKAAAAKWV